MKRPILTHSIIALVLLLMPIVAYGRERTTVSGVIKDALGAPISGANVSLTSANETFARSAETDSQGRFSITGVPPGTYQLAVDAKGFAPQRRAIDLRAQPETVDVNLEPGPIVEEVTVTAEGGIAEDPHNAAQSVNVIGELAIAERAKTVVAQVANEEPGVHLQRTSPTMSGIFVRGLTGNKVNVFVDGIRYSNAAQRGGVNTFLNLIEPSNLRAIEILRSANSAQYGSDAIGGSVQVLSAAPVLSIGGPRA